jgi:phytoene synthase
MPAATMTSALPLELRLKRLKKWEIARIRLSSRSQKGPFQQAHSETRVSASPSFVVNRIFLRFERPGERLAAGDRIGHRGRVDALRQFDPALRIALAWQPPATRPALAALLELDQRLGTLVSRAKEPFLAQMRLAWWRDQLSQIGTAVLAGEPLLAQLAAQWGEHAPRLAVLADGWESLLGDAPLSVEAIDAFAAGRGGAMAAFADLAGAAADTSSARAAGRGWALADFSVRTTDPRERESAVALGKQVEFTPVRAPALRGVAVIGGLSRRALQRDEPLLHGRGAVLRALRIGMFGR